MGQLFIDNNLIKHKGDGAINHTNSCSKVSPTAISADGRGAIHAGSNCTQELESNYNKTGSIPETGSNYSQMT